MICGDANISVIRNEIVNKKNNLDVAIIVTFVIDELVT